jgi:hypothetical protein
MTQYSLKKGLKKFKKVGEKAVSKELLQLHMRDTFIPQDVSKLSPDQKGGALESLVCLKEKRDETIKGRACAYGHKQREKATPGDATSPTVSLEAVLITSTIDAFKGREVPRQRAQREVTSKRGGVLLDIGKFCRCPKG